jgi:hypothetical protein
MTSPFTGSRADRRVRVLVINLGFALSALQETADVRVADPYIYAPALAGRLSASAADRVERQEHGVGQRRGRVITQRSRTVLAETRRIIEVIRHGK